MAGDNVAAEPVGDAGIPEPRGADAEEQRDHECPELPAAKEDRVGGRRGGFRVRICSVHFDAAAYPDREGTRNNVNELFHLTRMVIGNDDVFQERDSR